MQVLKPIINNVANLAMILTIKSTIIINKKTYDFKMILLGEQIEM